MKEIEMKEREWRVSISRKKERKGAERRKREREKRLGTKSNAAKTRSFSKREPTLHLFQNT